MSELTLAQRALAEAMSEVSELAYRAGWMERTEYAVWQLLSTRGAWGQAGAEELAPLLDTVRDAFRRAGCWIVWADDAPDVQPVALAEWRRRYAAWAVVNGSTTPVVEVDHPEV
ncbi:hypothetical protein [Streptomyces sp. NPDC059466]|uniref:hypothetical protein n=1 Tax=unclassified Streptomyces TaxID=2593676 RepID=UPI0036CF535A